MQPILLLLLLSLSPINNIKAMLTPKDGKESRAPFAQNSSGTCPLDLLNHESHATLKKCSIGIKEDWLKKSENAL